MLLDYNVVSSQLVIRVDEEKYLGTTVSKKLSWDTCIQSIAAKDKQVAGIAQKNLSPADLS